MVSTSSRMAFTPILEQLHLLLPPLHSRWMGGREDGEQTGYQAVAYADLRRVVVAAIGENVVVRDAWVNLRLAVGI